MGLEDYIQEANVLSIVAPYYIHVRQFVVIEEEQDELVGRWQPGSPILSRLAAVADVEG